MEHKNETIKSEIKHLRGYNKVVYKDPKNPKINIARLYQTPIFYENKLGIGDGDGGFRKIDATLHWDETKRAWTFEYNNYHPTIPEYADAKIEFRDLFHDKDTKIGLTPKAGHVLGRLSDPIAGMTNGYQAVIYDDAFGKGIDLIVHPTTTGLRKLVRMREYDKAKDYTFDFEMELPANLDASVARTRKEHKEKGGTNAKRAKATDLTGGKKIIIGTEEHRNLRRENFTYLRPVKIWDSGKAGENSGRKTEVAHAQILTVDGKKILRKTVPGTFLKDAVGDVFTDATTTISEDQDTYYGTVYDTGGAPNADNLKHGGWGDYYYSFLRWDLSSAPVDQKTLWARYGLKVYSSATNNPSSLLYIVTSQWDEADPTTATPPTYTSSGSMYVSSPITIGAGNWDIKEITHIYRLWQNGTYANYGITIRPTNNVDSVSSYYSSDHATEANRPYLEVGYVADTDKQTRQLIPGGLPIANLNNGATAYAAIQGHGSSESWTTTWHWRRALCAVDGAVRRIYYKLGTSPGAGKNYKFTLYRNGAAVWSTTIADANTQSYLDYGLNIFAGDDLVLGCTPTGTPTATTVQWGIEFWSADEQYAILAGSGAAPAVDGTTNYNNAAVGGSWFPTSNYTIENIIPHNATIRRFMVKLSTAPGAGKSWTFKALLGGTEVASVTISDTATTGDSGALSVDLAAGNHLMISVTGAGTPSTSSFMGWAFAIEPDEPGEFAIMGATANAFDATQETYNRVNGSYASAENTTRANVQRMLTFGSQVPAVKLKRFVARISVAAGDGKSYAISLEKNGSATDLGVTIAGASQVYDWDTAHEVSVAAQDLINIKIVPTGTPSTPTGRWSFVGYIAPTVDVQKDLDYVVTPTVRNKTLQYTVRKPIAITKTLAYTVETSPAITLGLAYTVRTVGAVTKDLAYQVKAPAEITKGLAYTIKTTPAEITLGLAYAVTAPAEITKGAQYTVKVPGAITKDLAYSVRTPGAITLGLAYVVRTISAITKGAQYAVKAPVEITKDLAYTLNTQQALTLALEYAVKSAEAVTKALAYTIRTTGAITKGAEYQVRSPQAITLGAEYAVKSPAEITKALAYAVKSAQALTKALAYTVQTPGAITKGAQYAIKSPVEVTKTLAYEINLVYTHELTKSLAYAVRTAQEATKALSYAIRTQNEATIGLEYEIKAPVEVTKGIKYTVQTTKELSKTLAYLVKTEKAITKSLQYEVRTEGSLTKGLAYTIRKPQAITKALAYSVASEQEITKGLEYAIISPETFTKELTYAVRTTKATTKALGYAVCKQHAITLGLEYQSGTIVDIHKTLAYAIRTESAITKALGYSVRATKEVTKTLKYEVIGSAEITKALRYAVTTTPANITKGLVYALRVWPYTKKSSPYSKKTGIFTAKSRPYHKFPKA